MLHQRSLRSRPDHQLALFGLVAAVCLIVCPVVCTTAHGQQSSTPASRPNIIFMLSDDQAWNGLSVPMHPDIPDSRSDVYQTPWLEKLAAQGMRFSTAYAPSAVCAPTRCSLQTGKSAAANHWTKVARSVTAADGYKLIPPQSIRHLPKDDVTIGELLQASGYATAHYGKWHLQGGGPGAHGYDDHDGNLGNEHAAKFRDPNPVDIFGMASRAEEFMQQHIKAGRPFFIQMSWHALHSPDNALQATLAKYRMADNRRPSRGLRVAAITEDLDTGVGRVLQSVERLGIADQTYIIYMSDNGAGGRGRPGTLRGGKGSVWEGGIRVPLIVRGPGVAANSWCHTLVVGYDFYPTFCEWAGIPGDELPEDIEGGSLVPLLRNQGRGVVERSRAELVFHFPHYQSGDGPHSAIRLGDLKLIRFDETGTSALFDLASDIGERTDLAAQMPDKVQELEKRLRKYLADVDAELARPNPNHDPAQTAASQRDAQRRRRGGQRGNQDGQRNNLRRRRPQQ